MPTPRLDLIDPDQAERWQDELAHFAQVVGADDAGNQRASMRSRQALYLAAFVDTYDASEACKRAGVSYWQLGVWRREDAAFGKAYDLAHDAVAEVVQGEVFRRAVQGVDQPVWHRGEQVGTERVYSDALLTKLAKRVNPALWGDGQAAVGSGDQTMAKLVQKVLSDPKALEAAQRLVDAMNQPSDSASVDGRDGGHEGLPVST